jgi:hypothetical protein
MCSDWNQEDQPCRKRTRSGRQGGAVEDKRGKQDDQCRDDEEDCVSSKRRRRYAQSPEDVQAPRFACPFFKRYPGEKPISRTCLGPGWPTVHRMKYACLSQSLLSTDKWQGTLTTTPRAHRLYPMPYRIQDRQRVIGASDRF